MNPHCPNCKDKLYQLLIPGNLQPTDEWACLACPYGLNRWTFQNGKMTVVQSKGADTL